MFIFSHQMDNRFHLFDSEYEWPNENKTTETTEIW